MLPRTTPIALTLLALGTSQGCGAPDGSDTRSYSTATDSAGIEIVHSGADGSLGTLYAMEDLRLGSLDEEGPELFSQVNAVAVGEGGHIFVGNSASVSVRVFDAEGVFLAEFGGRGEGPGELSMVNDLFVTGDTAVVVDWQRGGKVVLFRQNGEFLANWTALRPDGSNILPRQKAPEGWLMGVTEPFVRPSLSPGEVWERSGSVRLMQFGSDEVGPEWYSVPMTPLYGMAGAESGGDWTLFRRTWMTGFDGHGRMFMTSPDAYRIDMFDRGQLARSIRRDYTPRALSNVDVDAIRTAALGVIDTVSQLPDALRPAQRNQLADRLDEQARLPLPAIVAPFTDILVSRDGSFWVELQDTSAAASIEAARMFGGFDRFPAAETHWDLFDAEGIYLGQTTLPRRFRAEAVDGLTVVGVWADELDVQYVIRYSASPAGEV